MDEIEAALQQLQSGHVEAAAETADRLLGRSPDHPGVLNLGALVALQRGTPQRAVELWERALAARPDEPVLLCNLGAAYREVHRYDEAAESCERALRLRPGYENALVNLGNAQLSAGRPNQALAAYDEALRAGSSSAVVHTYRADALRELGRVRQAVEAYEHALEIDPGLHHAIGNLGVTLLAVGQMEGALELCRKATELAPESATGWMNLGTASKIVGRLEQAMDAYAEAHRLSSGSAELCSLIGDVWEEVSDLPQARLWYERALELEPDRIDARCGLAGVVASAGDAPGAASRYRDIIEQHPGCARAHLGLGAALWEDGDAESAVASCREAARLRPEDATALAQLGSIQASAGDVAAANATNRSALDVNPRCVPALVNLALNLRGRLPREEARQMEQLLGARWAREGPRAALHFGLGHYLDGREQYDRAADHFREANALQLAFKSERGWRYDPEEYERSVDRLIEAFPADHFERVRGFGDPSRVPVFVVGMPRSGTTLTEQILASHARTFGAGERNFTSRGFQRLPALVERPGADAVECLSALEERHVRQVAEWQLGQLWGLVGRAGRSGADTDRIADKMPDNFNLLGWIATLFPDARIVHCRRDVRDIAVSCWVTLFKEIRWAFDMEHIARRILSYERLMRHWQSVLPLQMLEVRYEDMVADQEAQTARLLEFVGLPWDDRCLHFHRTERLVRTASVTQVRQPIYGRSVERWRRYEEPLAPLFERLAAGSGD